MANVIIVTLPAAFLRNRARIYGAILPRPAALAQKPLITIW
jgi:hypothetical protein